MNLLTTAEVAKVLGVSVSTVNRRVASGRLVAEREYSGRGRTHLFNPDRMRPETDEGRDAKGYDHHQQHHEGTLRPGLLTKDGVP